MAVKWETSKVEKTLGTERLKGEAWLASAAAREKGVIADDRKWHTVRTGVQEINYTYPRIEPGDILEPVDLAMSIQEILSAQADGFKTLRTLVEHINYGLYQNTRAGIAKGADVRYNTAQRNAIKQFCDMAKAGLLDKDVAINGLLRQGITDAEELIDAALAS